MMEKKSNVLDLLLQSEIPQPQTKQYRHKRLSQLCGEDVILTLKEIPYNRVGELQRMEETSVHVVLSGVVDPPLKSSELLAKYAAETPAELVKKLFLPGEVEDISRAIERLSGYRTTTIEEIKKK
ncbi:hypothetical protein U6B65_12870 [Oscillospiraceae bacterium MB08-C2-2]|nr:hypothetical protein U6B65_12870 [Oscillospiraceae bacterium MB08-C2-2]